MNRIATGRARPSRTAPPAGAQVRSPIEARVRSRAGKLVGSLLAPLVVALTACLFLGAPAASAHDVLVSTSPADGSTLEKLPAEVVLTFGEPALALGTQIVVTGPGGAPVQQGTPVLVDATVHQKLGDGPAGRYSVAWRVTSADGHAVSGTFSFTTTAASSSTPTSSAPTAPTGAATSTGAAPGAATSSAGATTPTRATLTEAPARATPIDVAAPRSEAGTGGSSSTVWIVVAVIVIGLAALIAVVVALRRRSGRV